MKEKILHLTLTKRWFDMILYGEKKEEYREIKPYWSQRLTNMAKDVMCFQYRKYDYVQFTNGYGKDMPTMKVEFKGICEGHPAFKWIGKDPLEVGFVYIISLGDVIEISNVRIPNRKLVNLPGPLRRKYLKLSS